MGYKANSQEEELIRDGTVLINRSQGRRRPEGAMSRTERFQYRKWLEDACEISKPPRELCIRHHGVPVVPAHKEAFLRGNGV